MKPLVDIRPCEIELLRPRGWDPKPFDGAYDADC